MAEPGGAAGRPIRVLLVDDQELVRMGVALVLSGEDGIEIVGERSDGDEVVEAVRELRPDVVLLDIRMARMDGTEAMRALSRLGDHPPVLILTTFSDDDVLWGAMTAGAAGFILKDRPAGHIVRAIQLVAEGGSWIDPAASDRLLATVRDQPAADALARRRFERLSGREWEVLRAMTRGASNREIAAALHVSERTVKAHVGSIFLKLEARDRVAAIVLAFATGVAAPNEMPGG